MTSILGVKVCASNYHQVVEQSIQWAQNSESRTLIFANVHVIMEAYDDPIFRLCLDRADMVNPDGMPLVWGLKWFGESAATRVYGPDCTLHIIQQAAEKKIPIGFYGGSPSVLTTLVELVQRDYPTVRVVYAVSPPYRKLTLEEDEEVVKQITDSGARILLIGLGCPKQERWMDDHAARIPAVMYGVGAAFDFIAGAKQQAPRWMMKLGLEWMFRLCSEPGRLAKRYLVQNPRFILLFAQQWLRWRTRRELTSG